jgi:FlaA1/EpsC-like NDP-sugar epimerase
MFENAIILITGGTGSWGNELVKNLLNFPVKEIRIFSRNEFNQVLMQRKFSDIRLKFIIGDVRDFDALNNACKNVDLVYHLAALKHVPICEDFPNEAIKTNINGTQNIINAAINNNVKKVIDVSTDKAVEPNNLYGMTKSVGEKLILSSNKLSSTTFVCVRGGNVMGSNGSVIPLFKEQIANGLVTITDNRMTRYFLTLKEAIDLLIQATIDSFGGEIFVMKMPSCYIKDLSEVIGESIGGECYGV